ncbi:MAG: hypothetical protein ACYCZ0_02370 [Minisyncoccota bacterium]
MRYASAILGSLLAISVPALALAHGFGQRIDLPVPLYLYLFGGGAIVALSFIFLGLSSGRLSEALHAYPRFDLMRLRWFRALSSRVLLLPLKVVFVVILLSAIASGLWGNQNPAFNMLPTAVWIFFAIGVTFASALLGNIWSVVNPFKALYEWTGILLREAGFTRKQNVLPAALGVWPAVVLFFAFRWIENVSLMSSDPRPLAMFVGIYALITFGGMAMFGKEEWLRRGDPFSVFFAFLSRFSVTDARDGTIYLRPPAVGLIHLKASFSEMVFILLMLSSVAADGMLTTPAFQNIFSSLIGYGLPWFFVGTAGLAFLFAAFLAVYYGFSFLTKVISRDASSTMEFARRFIHSLLPIAVAYEIAHYVSILVIEGQRALYLISDPFGRGWNIFGTADYEISYTILNLKILWNVQVALIVVGHVIAVVIAHAVAERFFKDRQKAFLSQYPMLALMIFYSCLSLWIMAQPIIAIE